MQMPWKNDGGLWTVIHGWLKLNWATIYGAVLAVLIAYARIIYDGVNRKNRWLDALLCGALALTINGFLEGVGLPSSLTPFAGGMVGFIGIDKFHEIAIKFLNAKATRRGDNNYDDKNSPDINYNFSTVLNKIQVNLSLSTNLIYGELS